MDSVLHMAMHINVVKFMHTNKIFAFFWYFNKELLDKYRTLLQLNFGHKPFTIFHINFAIIGAWLLAGRVGVGFYFHFPSLL